MDDITEKLQKKELEMLLELSNLFEKNNIWYSLACGTVLGAVRHNGFIPWDDDIDIYIKAKDYDLVRNVFKSQDTGILVLQDATNTENYPYNFPKIVAKDTRLVEKALSNSNYDAGGVYIDLFPLVEVSDNKFIFWCEEILRYIRYSVIRSSNIEYNTSMKSILSIVLKTLFDEKSMQIKTYNDYSRTRKGHYYSVPDMFGLKSKKLREHFDSTIKYDFEGYKFPIPKNYESYLADEYGDWRTLPPKEERVSNHTFEELVI